MRTILQGESLEFDKPSMVLACCGCGMKHTVQLDEDEGRPVLRYFLWDVKEVSNREEHDFVDGQIFDSVDGQIFDSATKEET